MASSIIRKQKGPSTGPPPLLADYAAARTAFSWEAVAQGLGVSFGGPLNLGDLAVRRGGSLSWHGTRGEAEIYPAEELERRSGRFANALKAFGCSPGDRVVFLLRAVPELLFGILGALRLGVSLCVVPPTRNVETLRGVLELTGARVVVLDPQTKLLFDAVRSTLPALQQAVVLQKGTTRVRPHPGEALWEDCVDAADPAFESVPVPLEHPAVLQVGEDEEGGTIEAHRAAFALAASAAQALDLHAGDTLLTLSVPGDGLFLPYALLAPLLVGATSLVFEDPARFQRFASLKRPVNVWYSTSRALDVILRVDPGTGGLLRGCRHIAVTHPYDEGFVAMTEVSYGSPIHPTWHPPEIGAIQTAEFRAHDIRLGSVGRPLPGVEVKVDAGTGRLAVRVGPGTPFVGTFGDPGSIRGLFRDGWFVADDRGRVDPDGYAWIVS